METVSVKLEKSGRILIPAAIRRELGLKEGSELLLRPNDAGLQVSTRQQAIKRVQAQLRKYAPRGRLLSQELLDERREEAARENAK
jgi:AbrB family looped-hinge helix DNA binding protein